MIKLLHSADLHLGGTFRGLPPEKAADLRREQLSLPRRLAELAIQEKSNLVLLAGDLFDSPQADPDSTEALLSALREIPCPVLISPGNHDYYTWDSPYYYGKFPENVHIFTESRITSLAFPDLNCRVYGAGYRSMDCPALLGNFQKEGSEEYQVLLLHGEVTGGDSPYAPITRGQLAASGLHYAALGHIHKGDSLHLGETLCAWPGCPMGRGFDETGVKGALLVTLDGSDARTDFIPLGAHAYWDLEVPAGLDPQKSILEALPRTGFSDIVRITLTGETGSLDLPSLEKALKQEIWALHLRDQTRPRQDLWQGAGGQSLEGQYFDLLKKAVDAAPDEEARRRLILAAQISRSLLEGREVKLP